MKKKKIKYDTASNGLEAVQKWKSGGFHLILVCVFVGLLNDENLTRNWKDGYSDACYGRNPGHQGDPPPGEDEWDARIPQ